MTDKEVNVRTKANLASAFQNWRLRHSQLQRQAERRFLENLYYKSSQGQYAKRHVVANTTDLKKRVPFGSTHYIQGHI